MPTSELMQPMINPKNSNTFQLRVVVLIPSPAPAPGLAAPAEGSAW